MKADQEDRQNIRSIDFEAVRQFSAFDKFYANPPNQATGLYAYTSDAEGLQRSLAARRKTPVNRAVLCSALTAAYEQMQLHDVLPLINRLHDENTFTITCAHQPNIFTGPVFYIYKLLSTIKLADSCNRHFPGFTFLPVLYLGGEDHDLDELNHIYLSGEKLSWNTGQAGAVGRMHCTGMEEIIQEIKSILSHLPYAAELEEAINEAYRPEHTLNRAITIFLHRLLSEFDFLVLDADNHQLKSTFIPAIKKDILEQQSKALVMAGQQMMEKLDLQVQANPRDINFFYLSDGSRQRIIENDTGYNLTDESRQWTRATLEAEIEQFPHHFSANVIMRPLLQEFILPSIAFVGGGGELAYWSDRKKLFEAYAIHFPVLVRRDSFLMINENIDKKINKLKLTLDDLFLDEHKLQLEVIGKNEKIKFDIEEERKNLANLIHSLTEKAIAVDPTLQGYVGAEGNQISKILDHIDRKIIKSQKRKNEDLIQRARIIQQILFPGDNLQERQENFMTWYAQYGREFFRIIFAAADPLDIRLKVITLP